MTAPNTLFLRLEGPLQAWGDNSKFVIRRTMEAPTKSGAIGLICCAMGLTRPKARERLTGLNALAMGVRIDWPGTRWWDYHTVGAGVGLLRADGELKTGAQGTLITRREYLADASFLVALQGDSILVAEMFEALQAPKWPVFLGRKSCPPSTPVLASPREGETWSNPSRHADLPAALRSVPWHPRLEKLDGCSEETPCLVEWRPSEEEATAPIEAEVWYDSPVSFDPPVHEPRLVTRTTLKVVAGAPTQKSTPLPPRPRADYTNADYRKRRQERLDADHGLCVFCKSPASTVQHVTYRRAGGEETHDDLRALCRLCHDAVTMIEYGQGMGLNRINPEEPCWRDTIIERRKEIVEFRSLETRRRRLSPEEVE